MTSIFKTPLLCALALAGTLLGGTAAATTIYRCGPDGRLFSDKACGGAAQVISPDTPSVARRAEARQVFLREQALASSLQTERRQRERQSAGEGAAGIFHTPTGARAEQPAPGFKRPTEMRAGKRGKQDARPRNRPSADPHLSFEVKVPAPGREPKKRGIATRRAG